MKFKDTLTTLGTLGNAAELVASVSEKVLGGEVAATFGGSALSRDVVLQLAQSTFQKKIATDLGK